MFMFNNLIKRVSHDFVTKTINIYGHTAVPSRIDDIPKDPLKFAIPSYFCTPKFNWHFVCNTTSRNVLLMVYKSGIHINIAQYLLKTKYLHQTLNFKYPCPSNNLRHHYEQFSNDNLSGPK